ncbi:MAG: hypothetical protein PVI43_04365 [Candidatus Bathyarchaeota archaeon]
MAILNTFTDAETLYWVMKHMKLFWTIGCWISLLLVSIYHNVICCYESAFPVWYSTFIVWAAGVLALSTLAKTNNNF